MVAAAAGHTAKRREGGEEGRQADRQIGGGRGRGRAAGGQRGGGTWEARDSTWPGTASPTGGRRKTRTRTRGAGPATARRLTVAAAGRARAAGRRDVARGGRGRRLIPGDALPVARRCDATGCNGPSCAPDARLAGQPGCHGGAHAPGRWTGQGRGPWRRRSAATAGRRGGVDRSAGSRGRRRARAGGGRARARATSEAISKRFALLGRGRARASPQRGCRPETGAPARA